MGKNYQYALLPCPDGELFLYPGELDPEPKPSDTTVRFWCPELSQEGQWHHLVLIFHKAGIIKNSSVSLYIDGVHANTQKVPVQGNGDLVTNN